uniref:Uncharacterized protein n=1 Tax=Arundo donax TaxID=35708 RepID=A0A0A9AP90_ARUDO
MLMTLLNFVLQYFILLLSSSKEYYTLHVTNVTTGFC